MAVVPRRPHLPLPPEMEDELSAAVARFVIEAGSFERGTHLTKLMGYSHHFNIYPSSGEFEGVH